LRRRIATYPNAAMPIANSGITVGSGIATGLDGREGCVTGQLTLKKLRIRQRMLEDEFDEID
jgi:hypothetical protein